ncbi:MAG: YeeE/YedE family protein [Synechococcus sp.]
MVEFNWITALLGGILIGVSATLLLALNGRIAGISGILNGAIQFSNKDYWQWFFLLGRLIGGGIYVYTLAPVPTPRSGFVPMSMVLGGFLVGFGTRMGNGCTSGHGVCGLGRFSLRSLAAVLTFLATGVVTVFVIRHLLAL